MYSKFEIYVVLFFTAAAACSLLFMICLALRAVVRKIQTRKSLLRKQGTKPAKVQDTKNAESPFSELHELQRLTEICEDLVTSHIAERKSEIQML